jgi:ferrous iron transport protein A
MTETRQISVTEMANGQHGVVQNINGGHNVIERLHALGIRPGKNIVKVGAMMMRGPVTVSVNNRQVAMGHSMASKVTIELLEA